MERRLGYGSKIDKMLGRSTNQLEVIGCHWFLFVTTKTSGNKPSRQPSSLQNTVVFPYAKVIQLTKGNSSRGTLEEDVLWVRKTYTGNDEAIRKALTSVLGIATTDTI